ncbi:MAG: hypothetical protein EA356_01360 [Geminicoccaceae bacterium]|nr:MAG: hypothetical protein EA356_01360 [Geminicoccaceae bacterium]
MHFEPIALNRLVPAEVNVRKARDPAAVRALANSIVAEGLLQNLVVVRRADGNFEVVAGEGRRQAMRLAAEEGKLDPALAVPCRVVDGRDAACQSLAENVLRTDLELVDLVEAYGKIGQTLKPKQLAHRFGISQKEAKQVVALGQLSPKALTMLRAGTLDTEGAKALTLVPSHGGQDALLDQLAAEGKRATGWMIREAVLATRIATTDPLARFAADEIQAAKIPVIGDLFSDRAHLADGEAVRRLAEAKLQAMAKTREAEGWAAVKVFGTQHFPWNTEHESVWPADREAGYTVEERQEAELWLRIDQSGGLAERVVRPRTKAAGASNASAEKNPISATLQAELWARRSLALQDAIARDPEAAYDVALTVMLAGILEASWSVPSECRASKARLNGMTAEQLGPAREDMERRGEAVLRTIGIEPGRAWDLDWATVFDAIRAMPEVERKALFAWCVAVQLEALPASNDHALFEHLGRVLQVDVRQTWTPDTASLFGRIGKTALLDMLGFLPATTKAAMAKMPKGELSKTLEALFRLPDVAQGPGFDAGVSSGAVQCWLPPGVGFEGTAASEQDLATPVEGPSRG